MGTFLKLLEVELSSLDQNDFYEPEAELESEDHIVGEMSEDAIRLFTLWRQTARSCAEKKLELRYGQPSGDQSSQLKAQAAELHEKSDLIGELFWLELKDEHKLWGKSGIGVRKGRHIVWFERKEGPSIFGLDLGKLGLDL